MPNLSEVATSAFVAAGDKDGFWANAYPIIPHPAELIVSLVAFSLVFIVAAKFVVPAFEKMYTERYSAIEGGMREAEEAQAEADALLQEYKAQLADAREEAGRIREQARSDAAEIAAQIRDQATADAERIVSTAHRQIDAERSAATTQLTAEIGRLATELAEKIVGESLQDSETQRRVVDRFLADLEAEAAPVASTTVGEH